MLQPRRNCSPQTCLWDLCFTKLTSRCVVQGFRTICMLRLVALPPLMAKSRVLPAPAQGAVARHSTGCVPPEMARIHLNSTESHRVASGIRSHRQLRDATASKTAAPQDTAARHRTVSRLPQRAAHARTEQDSCRQKGCPTRHASGHHRPPDGSPGRSKAIAQSSLAVAGMERHGPADGRRMAPQ